MTQSYEKVIIASSGGLDSCVTTAIAAQDHEIAMLHVQYGQRTEKKELECFKQIAEFYNVTETLITSLPHLRNIKGSSLTDHARDVEKGEPGKNTIPSTYVPFRNGAILSIAVAWAEVTGAMKIFIGAVEEDSSGYPDCREIFFRLFEKTANLGSRPENKIEIVTPIIRMNKAEIIRKGNQIGAPLHLTWSCYVDGDVACGECESCYLRRRGFEEAGIEDPIKQRESST